MTVQITGVPQHLGQTTWQVDALLEEQDDEGTIVDYHEDVLVLDTATETLNQALEREGWTIDDADRRRVLAEIFPPPDKARITKSDRQLDALMAEAVDALGRFNQPEPSLFRQGNFLVHFEVDENGDPVSHEVKREWALLRLADVADWYTRRGQRLVDAKPDPDVAKSLLAARDWTFPPLRGIVRAPVMRPNGSILQREGYDLTTGRYFHRPPGLRVTVPDTPSDADVRGAIELLSELLHDFRFASHADKVGYLAFLLTPLLRPVIGPDAVTPLCLIESPTAGSGKTLLAQCAMIIHTGTVTGMTPLPQENEDEVRKTLYALLLKGKTFIVFDNVTRLESDPLKATLTMPRMDQRILQYSRAVDVPNSATWAATGNNVVLDREMTRRSYRVRVTPETARPDLLTDFMHYPLTEWVAERRNDLLAALLTLCRAWVLAGRPRWTGRTLASFEPWAQVVGGVLEVAGRMANRALASEFLANMADLWIDLDDDTTEAEVKCFTAWWERFRDERVTVDELLEARIPIPGVDLMQVNAARHAGIKLRELRDNVAGDFILRRAAAGSGATGGQAKWQLQPIASR